MDQFDKPARPDDGPDDGPDLALDDALRQWWCTWETGPDSGATFVLGAGRYLLGRAAGATLRCDDPALEAHHAELVVDHSGIRVAQLTGRLDLLVDGRAAEQHGSLTVIDGGQIEIGHSVLRCRSTGTEQPAAADLRNGTVLRGPRPEPLWRPVLLTPPAAVADRLEATGGLLPAVLGLVGSAAVAVAMRQPMFLIFGALGAMVAFGSWLAQRLGLVRRNRRGARSHRRAARVFAVDVALARTDFVAHHLATTSTTASARATIERRDDRLWARRGTHSDGFSVSLGTGVLAWQLPLTDATSPPAEATIGNLAAASATTCLADLPIVVNLAGGARLALRGSAGATRAAARGLLTQLAANCGPADVRIVIVTHEAAAWRWAIQLPQATNADGDSTVIVPSELSVTLAALDRPGAPHIVCVTDAAELLAARTSALRRALGTAADIALVVLVGADSGIPHLCHQSLSIPAAANAGSVPVARWVPDTNAGAPPAAVRVAGIGERAAAVLAGRLGELTDPDDPFAGIAAIPAAIGLIELLDDDDGSRLSGASVAARWLADSADPRPRTPIGVASDGIVDLDLDRDGPHGLIAGTTGSGKSELLRSLVAGMAVGSSPDHLTFVLVDYKGGATFDALTTLPHVVGVVTDLDEHLADRALRSLNAELRRREALLRQYGASDLAALRAANANVLLPRLVVVIDEFAALVAEQPEFLHALVGVAQRGRSLGVHLLLATQRPSGVISDDIRANTNIRIALRLNDTTDAIDVIGEITPALISRRAPGRAVVRLGPDEHVTFQTARCTGSDDDVPSDIDRIVAAVHAAVQIVGIATPRGPWQPPLATVIDSDVPAPDPTGPGVFAPGVFAPGVIGMVDDPDHQRIEPLRWNSGEGHLLVGGTRGSGVTSTLMTLGHAALTGSQPPHLYIIDAVGDDALLAFAHHPRCAAVVRLHENERLQRLLLRVAGIVAARAANGGRADGEPSLLLLIDGFTALRRRLDQLDTAAQFEALESIVVNGHGTDTTVVLATDQPSAVPATTLARCPNRWIMHLADRHEANAWGFSAADVPASIPGRVAIGVGVHAQLIRPKRIAALNIVYDTGPHDAGPGGVAEPVTCLPETIAASTLEAATVSAHSTWIPLGVEFAGTTTAVIEIPDGEHVMIIGPTRCGRSTAMARLVAGWSTAHRDGWVGVLAPRSQKPGSSTAGCSAALRATHRTVPELLAAMPDVGAALIAVDDAELVDDPSGALTTLAASRREGLLIVASAKPDVVRQTYGHWTAVVRRSRLGLIAAASSDLDGDLLGATLPRRLPVAARAGLMWLTSNGSVELIQVAVDGHRRPETSEARADRLGATPSGQADPASRRLAEEGVG